MPEHSRPIQDSRGVPDRRAGRAHPVLPDLRPGERHLAGLAAGVLREDGPVLLPAADPPQRDHGRDRPGQGARRRPADLRGPGAAGHAVRLRRHRPGERPALHHAPEQGPRAGAAQGVQREHHRGDQRRRGGGQPPGGHHHLEPGHEAALRAGQRPGHRPEVRRDLPGRPLRHHPRDVLVRHLPGPGHGPFLQALHRAPGRRQEVRQPHGQPLPGGHGAGDRHPAGLRRHHREGAAGKPPAPGGETLLAGAHGRRRGPRGQHPAHRHQQLHPDAGPGSAGGPPAPPRC